MKNTALPAVAAVAAVALAARPASAQFDPRPTVYRPAPPAGMTKIMPPPGIAVPETLRADLRAGADALGKTIADLRDALKDRPELARYLPDVEIFYRAVDGALDLDEFFSEKEYAQIAPALLREGSARADALRAGKTPWLEKPGPTALGYVSAVDGSVQPYGIVIPPEYKKGDAPRRLDFFFHGRNEKLTELAFLSERQRSGGEFTPPGAFVLHPYGRMCNANRFAGETDTFEALADAKTRFPMDDNRVAVRGFSMGGAACWTFATHYAGLWAAAAPGAGFAESAEYTKAFAPGKTPPPWYEQTLWHLYDATDYALNLANVPTVAYSGEVDPQKQAGDRMVAACRAESLSLLHVIGPGTAHKYHPDSKREINAFVDAAVAKGRDPLPARVRFTTWTLRYHRMAWVEVAGLGRHWKRARVDATFADGVITAATENVTAVSFARTDARAVALDGGKPLPFAPRYVRDPKSRSWRAAKAEKGGGYEFPNAKRPGLQGPIDDAFYGTFVFVRPTGTAHNPALGGWTLREMDRAAYAWRKFFRGDVRIINDTDWKGPDDPLNREAHLILWGDTGSNAVLKAMAKSLPFRWDGSGVKVGDRVYPGDRYAPAFVYPNPFAQRVDPRARYVVINSGFTFVDYAAASNAQHAPKLPDWAVLDLTAPGPVNAPGKIATAGFFDENWKGLVTDGK
jgi:hypothetical protein